MQVTIVTTKQLCSACHIVEQAVREMVKKQQAQMPELEVIWAVYDSLDAAVKHPGLEMPAFPALFYEGEQLTAGTIPSVAEMRAWFSEGGSE